MNILGYDAMTLGNHEFDHGDELLSRLYDFAKFPIVSSNLKYKDSSLSSELIDFKSNQKYSVGNLSLYVIGVTTLETLEVASPTKNIQFIDPTTGIENELKKIYNKEKNQSLSCLVV